MNPCLEFNSLFCMIVVLYDCGYIWLEMEKLKCKYDKDNIIYDKTEGNG